MLSTFTFQWPWVLLLAPLPWLVARWLPPARRPPGPALRVPFFDDLLTLDPGVKGRPRARDLERLARVAVWLLVLIAAARPQAVGEPLPVTVTGRDLVLAVDVSGSMDQLDFAFEGRAVTRLGVVKRVAQRFIERRRGDRLGLILFGAQAYVQTPLTFDHRTVGIMLDEAAIGLAGKQTAIGDAIGLAIKRMREDPAREHVLVLLTDGANTAGALSPERAAELAAAAGLRVYTIGIGSTRPAGSLGANPARDLDEAALRRIARVTGGSYFRAQDAAGLEAIYARLDELEPAAADDELFRPLDELYRWPLALALALSALLAARHARSTTGVGGIGSARSQRDALTAEASE